MSNAIIFQFVHPIYVVNFQISLCIEKSNFRVFFFITWAKKYMGYSDYTSWLDIENLESICYE